MNNIVVDIKDLLIAPSSSPFTFGGLLAWAVFLNEEPTEPNNCVTIYSLPSRPPVLYNDPSHAVTEYPDFQIRVRGINWQTSYNMIKLIESMISHIGSFSVGTMKYMDIIPQTSEYQLPDDDNGRKIWVQSFFALRENKP